MLAFDLGILFASLCESRIEVIADLWNMAYEADLVVVFPIVLELVSPVLVQVPCHRNPVSETRAARQSMPSCSIVCVVYDADAAEVLAASKGVLDMLCLAQLACVSGSLECLGLFCGFHEHPWCAAMVHWVACLPFWLEVVGLCTSCGQCTGSLWQTEHL